MGKANRIEIEYRPIKRVTILDCTKLSLKELANRIQTMTQLGQPIPLNWAEGVAFFVMPLPVDTENLVERQLNGEVVLQNIVYALMSEYSPTIKAKPFDVHVLNQTPSKVMRELSLWLKNHAVEDYN